MSKLVKRLVSRDIQGRLDGVQDAVLVNLVGMEGNTNCELRKAFRQKGVTVLVVKRTLAARATGGTSLAPAFNEVNGSIAVAYGCEDFVSLAKEITAMDASGAYKGFEIKGGVMDGEAVTADQVKAISKWPSRREQISLLVGQILSPGANLSAQLLGPAKTLAGQVKKIIENQEEGT
jgi:large subunit ribosomal protein L10